MVLQPFVQPSASSTSMDSRKKVRITGELYWSSSFSLIFFVNSHSLQQYCVGVTLWFVPSMHPYAGRAGSSLHRSGMPQDRRLPAAS